MAQIDARHVPPFLFPKKSLEMTTDFKESPELSAWFISSWFYDWLTPLVWKGFKKPIDTDDLYKLRDDICCDTLVKRFDELWEEEVKIQKELHSKATSNTDESTAPPEIKVSSLKVLWKQFGKLYAIIGVFHLIQAAANITSPVLISLLTGFAQRLIAEPNGKNPPLWEGALYSLAVFGLQLCATLSLNRYFYYATTIGIQARACLSAVIYRKMLRLSAADRQRYSAGQIVNLISSDLPRLEMTIMQGHYVWSGPTQIIAILGLLIFYIGWPALIGVGILVLMVPLQAKIFLTLGRLRQMVAGTTDARIKLTQEYLHGMKIIKLFGWEFSFLDRIMDLRKKEVGKIRFVNMWTSLLMGVSSSLPILASVLSFIVYAISNPLNPADIFSSLALFNLMRFPLILLPMIIRQFAESKVAITRVDQVLNAEEIEDVIHNKSSENSPYAVEIVNGSFRWESAPEEKTSKEEAKSAKKKKSETTVPDSYESPPRDSHELSDIEKKPVDNLKNINCRIKKGSLVAIVGPVGSGKSTLLNAILGEVKRVSGEIHVNGSIAYSLQHPWIQNGSLRKNVIFGREFDQKKFDLAIHATALDKDLEWLPAGENTLLGEKGVQISGGQKARVSCARVVYEKPDIAILDDPLSAVDVHVGAHLFEECIKKSLAGSTVILVTHQLSHVRDVDHVILMNDGEISEQGSYNELMEKNGELARLMKSYVGDENKKNEKAEVKEKENKAGTINNQPVKQGRMLEEERASGSVSFDVYINYLKALGGVLVVMGVLILSLLTQGSRIGSDLWLVSWSNDEFNLDYSQYSGIYFSFGISTGILTVVIGIYMAFAIEKASKNFHESAIKGVFGTPIAFFDTTPLGRIVNRFSRDTDTMDSKLPTTLQWFLNTFFGLIGTLVLMSIASPFLLVAIVPLGIIYYFVMTLYLRTSRELKRLEAISRSPVYAHFGESLTGLSTIRAYDSQRRFILECDEYIDDNNQAYYLQIIMQRWLGVRLELIGAIIVFLTTFLGFLGVDNLTLSVALYGASLAYALQVTGSLNFTVRQAVEIEVNSNSIERLHHYATSLVQEAAYVIEDKRPPKEWPSEGKIEVRDLVVRYGSESDAVIKGVSFSIKPKEKIGIVGRTGAGKSTITSAFFRLIEPESGSILIDGKNVQEMGLHDLRCKLSIIPQDPVLFSGTIRTNLDPTESIPDQQIWDVLASVNMRDAVSKLPERLEATVESNGENFSSGQRQLFCLARAMLRKPKVLIMDEATANVDMESDALIQKSIRQDFSDSTVLTIAHRLNTVIDYDRILVLASGKVVEFDTPRNLLQKNDGLFSKMVDETGSNNSQVLRKQAAESSSS